MMDDKDSDASGERRSGFRSYVDSPRSSLASDVGDFIYPPADTEDSVDLLEGEVIVTKARGVLRFFPLSDQKQGISGVLLVTNFKLSFVAPGYRAGDAEPRCEGLKNSLLKPNEICLANIDSIFSVAEDGRRRRLSQQLADGMRVDVLEIQCKDFRVASYGFKFTSLEETKLVTNALLHHAFPLRVELLFAFECKLRSLPDPRRTRMFYDPADWHEEMQRTKCSGWRVSYANEHFQVCYSLPKHLVVPQTLLDKEINEAASHYNKNRVPVWVWGTPEGAALVHSAKTAFEQSPHEEGIKQALAESHPSGSVHFIDLDAFLPSSADVQDAFVRWRSLHVPCTSEEFREGDNRYFSEIHSSQWLHYVSKCLREACEIAILLCEDHKTVVLQEGEGRDVALLVSSLIQVLADPYFRTQVGFQGLIQKEWVALGHPFCSRFSRLQQPAHLTPVESNSASVAFSATGTGITTLTANPTGMAQSNQTLSAVPATLNVRPEHSGQSPVFLLFLDCVWQVLRQYPKEFEFTQTFLTAVWDSAHVSIFDTFLFDCVKDRENALQSESDRLTSRSVWTWEYQYEPCYLECFESPVAKLNRILASMSRSNTPDDLSTPAQNGLRGHEGVLMRRKSSANRSRTAERAERNAKSRSIPITTLFSRMRRGDFSVTNNLNMDSINWEHGLSKLHEGNDGPRVCDLRWNQLSDYARDLQMDEPDYPPGYFEQRISAGRSELGRIIVPRPQLSRLQIWNELYSRWLPITHIRFGGEDAFQYMTEMALIEDIIELKERIQRLDNDRSVHDGMNGATRDDVDEISRGFTRLLRMENLVSSFPFSSERNDLENGPYCVETITGFSRHYSNDDMLDSQSFIENQDTT